MEHLTFMSCGIPQRVDLFRPSQPLFIDKIKKITQSVADAYQSTRNKKLGAIAVSEIKNGVNCKSYEGKRKHSLGTP
jgi:hypothetical protein